MNSSARALTFSPAASPKHNSFVGYTSLIAIFTTLFAGFGFVGSSLIGMFFAFLVIIFSFEKIRIDAVQALSMVILSVYCTFALILADNNFVILQNIRYWFGVLLYILFFIACRDGRLISFGAVRFLCLSILLESLLVNMAGGTSELLHPGSNETGIIFMGWYERPISFAGNPGTSGIALLVLFFMTEKLLGVKATKLDWLLLFASVISLVSGTALGGLVLLLVLRSFDEPRLRYTLMRASIAILPVVYILFNTDAAFIQKFSLGYFIEIFNLKFQQIEDASSSELLNEFFGSQLVDVTATTSGDFGWLLLFTAMGWLGFGIYFLLVVSFYRGGKTLFPVLLLMLIGTTHYPSAMSPAGQLIMAMLLTFTPCFTKKSAS